jgi:hypothetical protein
LGSFCFMPNENSRTISKTTGKELGRTEARLPLQLIPGVSLVESFYARSGALLHELRVRVTFCLDQSLTSGLLCLILSRQERMIHLEVRHYNHQGSPGLCLFSTHPPNHRGRTGTCPKFEFLPSQPCLNPRSTPEIFTFPTTFQALRCCWDGSPGESSIPTWAQPPAAFMP